MSSNFFAALGDDSGDEAPPKAVAPKKATAPSSAAATKKKVVTVQEPSKPLDARSKKAPSQGDRNTKYGRGGRAPVRDGKRAYDRRSGTGRGREIKKGGGGAHNWGSDQNEAKEATGEVRVDEENRIDDSNTGAAEAEQEEEEEVEEPVVVEDNTMSYEEYLEAQKEKKSELLKPVQERTVDTSEFASLLPKAGKAEVEDFLVGTVGKQKRKKAKEASTAVSATELLGNIRIASGDGGRSSSTGRGRGRGGGDGRSGGDGRGPGRGRGEGRGRGPGRGGRGRGEGGRGRGRGSGRDSGRGGRAGTSINTLDAAAFPSLG